MHEMQMKALTFHCSKVLTRCSFSNRYLRPGLMFLARRAVLQECQVLF